MIQKWTFCIDCLPFWHQMKRCKSTGRIEGKYVSERTFEKVKSCLAKAEEIKKGVKKSEDISDEKGQENLDENLSTPAGTS